MNLLISIKNNIDLIIMIAGWAIAIIGLIIAIKKRDFKHGSVILLVVSSFLTIFLATLTYYKADEANQKAKQARIIADKINKGTKLSIMLDCYPPEIKKQWIDEEDEFYEELKNSKAEEADKVLAKLSFGLASTALDKKDIKACIEFLDYSLFFVETGLIHNMKGVVYYNTDTTKAIEEYRLSIKINPGSPISHNNYSTALIDKGLYADAERECREAIGLKQDYANAHANLGKVLKIQGKFDEAVKEYDMAIRLKPTDAGYYLDLALVFRKQGKIDEEIETYGRGIKANPKYPKLYNNLGVALMEKGSYRESEVKLRKAVGLDSSYANAHSNLGQALEKQDKIVDAIGEYRKAIGIKPDLIEAYKNFGRLLIKQKKFAEAEPLFKKAKDLNQNDTDVLEMLAIIYDIQGKRKEGREIWMQAEKLEKRPDQMEIIKKRLAETY